MAVGLDGKVTVRWAKIPNAKKLAMTCMLPRRCLGFALSRIAGAEWLLGKAINQRVTDGNRGSKKRGRD